MRLPTITIAAAALALLAAAGPAAAANVTPPRAGQVGIGLQLGYGSLLKGGGAGDTFADGLTYTVRLRYRMRYDRGFGLSFESSRFDSRVRVPWNPDKPDDNVAPERLGTVLSGIELYQMFGTRTPTVRMISVGLGIGQHRVKLNSGETELSGKYSGDGPFLSAGAGIERFFYRSWAADVSVRYYAMFKDGVASHNVQVALGVIGYAGY